MITNLKLPPINIKWSDDTTDLFFERQIGNYRVLSKLGKGKYGVVKAGEDVINNTPVAIKLIYKQTLNDIEQETLKTEAMVMNYIKHQNVINLYEVFENRDYICVVMEYAGGGDLYDYVVRQTKLQEVVARRLFIQMLDALGYCHEKGVVHRDLKPENVFLDERLETVKIGDWGFSAVYNPNSTLITACGSLEYSSPEILSGKPHVGPEVDVWALGVVLYFMVCGWLPFRAATDFEVYSKIKRGDYRPMPAHLSESLKNFVRSALTIDPQKRPSIAKLKQDEWCEKAQQDPEYLKRPKLPRLLQLQIRSRIRDNIKKENEKTDQIAPSSDSINENRANTTLITNNEKLEKIRNFKSKTRMHTRSLTSSEPEKKNRKSRKKRREDNGKSRRPRRHKIYEEEEEGLENEDATNKDEQDKQPEQNGISVPVGAIKRKQESPEAASTMTKTILDDIDVIRKEKRPSVGHGTNLEGGCTNISPQRKRGSVEIRNRGSRPPSTKISNISVLRVDEEGFVKLKGAKEFEILSSEKDESEHVVVVSARIEPEEVTKVMEHLKNFEAQTRLKRSKSVSVGQKKRTAARRSIFIEDSSKILSEYQPNTDDTSLNSNEEHPLRHSASLNLNKKARQRIIPAAELKDAVEKLQFLQNREEKGEGTQHIPKTLTSKKTDFSKIMDESHHQHIYPQDNEII